MIQPSTKCRPARLVAYRQIGDSLAILHPEENRLLTLNSTGAAIWERLDGRSVLELAQELASLFRISQDRMLKDTMVFLTELDSRHLLEFGEDGDDR